MERIGVAIVGGGAVGCAVAWELAQGGARDVFVLESHPAVGEVQSGHSSGVVHAGIYYPTGSLKASLCLEGNVAVYEFCRAHQVAAAAVGKLVVATTDGEVAGLEALLERARANGVPGVRLLSRAERKALEPGVEVPAAMYVPTTGILDAASYVAALAARAEGAGASVLTGFEVTGVVAGRGGFRLTGVQGRREESFEAEVVVNAAGLHCDEVGRMVNPALVAEVVPLRGEFCRLNRRRRAGLWLNGHNVYPLLEPLEVAGETRQVVTVHLTPTFARARDGSVEVGDVVTVGPEFGVVARRDDYETGRRPPEHFLQRVRRFLPALELDDLALDFSGIMVSVRGVTDWRVERDARFPGCVQLIGIDSPGLTGSLAIARHVRRLLLG